MSDHRVWCLLIDHEKKAVFGDVFSIKVPHDAYVDDLKMKIKELRPDVLEHVVPGRLTVWRCTDSGIDFADIDSDKFNDRLNEVFSPNEQKVKKLKPKQELRQLTEKTLLIEVPDSLPCPSDLDELRHPVSAKKRKRDNDTSSASNESQTDLITARRLWKICWGVALSTEYTSLPRRRVLGNDQANSVILSPIKVENGDLLPGAPFLDGILDGMRFLVRAEYIRMYEYVEDCFAKEYSPQVRRPAVIITGQPGIGKTVWIQYALRRCIGERRPVMLMTNTRYLFFSESGVEKLPSDAEIFDEQKPINETPWCLIDSTSSPKGIPVEMSAAFSPGVNSIYLTSPDSNRWRGLQQSRTPKLALMNPWSWEEVSCVARAFNLDMQEVSRRFEHFGPTARICIANGSEAMKRHENECQDAIKDIQDMATVIEATVRDARDLTMAVKPALTSPATLSHKICLVRRRELDRISLEHDMSIMSDFIANLCAVQLQQLEDDQVLKVWRLFSKHGEGKGMIGAIFEAYVHANFRKWISIDAKQMFSSTADRLHKSRASYMEHPRLQSSLDRPQPSLEGFRINFSPSSTVIYMDAKNGLSIMPNIYYQPKKDQQVGIDSLFIRDGYLYLLQITGGNTHMIKPELKAFLEKLDGLPAKEKWRFVFVIPANTVTFSCPMPSIVVGKVFADRFAVQVCPIYILQARKHN
ncbi:hypothetical protein ACEPAF_8730 [Sanghuangporus sanghuang]